MKEIFASISFILVMFFVFGLHRHFRDEDNLRQWTGDKNRKFIPPSENWTFIFLALAAAFAYLACQWAK